MQEAKKQKSTSSDAVQNAEGPDSVMYAAAERLAALKQGAGRSEPGARADHEQPAAPRQDILSQIKHLTPAKLVHVIESAMQQLHQGNYVDQMQKVCTCFCTFL